MLFRSDELFEICDVLYVMANGELSPRIPIEEANIETIGALMGGTSGKHSEIRHGDGIKSLPTRDTGHDATGPNHV